MAGKEKKNGKINENIIIHPALAADARKVMDINKQERHIRGGMATKVNTIKEIRRKKTDFM